MLLRSVYASSAPSGPELPGRICIAKWGRNKSVKKDYTVNETTLRALPVTQPAMGFDTVDLDFDHNTVPGSPAYKADKEPRKRAAFGALEVVPGEGVFLNVRNWTPEGKEGVQGHHFKDLSPAIVTNSAGEVIFIHSAALCRQGCTEGLEIQLNSADFGDLAARLQTHSAAFSPTKPTPQTMNPDTALLLTLLGLPETATQEEKNAAAKAFAAKIDASNTAANAATGAVQTMSVELKRLAGLFEGNEKEKLLNEAIAAGKLVTQSISGLPLEHLKAVLADLRAGVVPLDRRTPAAIQTHSASVVGAGDPVAAAMDRAAGLTPDDIKKYGGN